MAEIAGLALGGIPIAIWVLEKYAEPFETFHRYRTSIETFQTDLTLQNRQLQTTLCNLGLDDQPSREDLHKCFNTKFPSISRELITIVQRMDDVTARLLKGLDVDFNEKPNRTQWEWHRVKHSFSIRKRKKVIDDLRRWNDDLRRAVEKPEMPAEDDSGTVQKLKRRFNIERCNSIRQCLSSLHRALERGFGCACSPPHQAAIDLDWETIESSEAKSFKIALSYGTHSQTPQLLDIWRKLHVTPHSPSKISSSVPNLQIPPPTPVRASSPSSLRSKIPHFRFPSLSRTPSPPPTPSVLSSASTAVSATASTEITSLCHISDTAFNLWTLEGFLKDSDEDQGRQFSFDHNQPDLPEIIKAVPLKSLLLSHEQPARRQAPYVPLSAEQRYGMAASAAWSVLHLSGSPWLGDRWDEEQTNIFLERKKGDGEIFSRYPCASYRFLPPTSPEQPVADDFSYLIPNRTVFALGVLLIELCINRPFANIRQTSESLTAALQLDYYQDVVSKLEEVRLIAGDSYGDAAERCVKFTFPGRDLYKNFIFSQFRQQFYDGVVAPVQATYLRFQD